MFGEARMGEVGLIEFVSKMLVASSSKRAAIEQRIIYIISSSHISIT